MDELDILWNLYQDDREFARHHESRRTQGASLVIAIAAGLIAVISLDQKISYADLPSAVLLIALGIFGIIFTHKHYERTRLHLNRAYQYYWELDRRLRAIAFEKLREAADEITRKKFGQLMGVKLSALWMVLHAVIVVIGLMVGLWPILS